MHIPWSKGYRYQNRYTTFQLPQSYLLSSTSTAFLLPSRLRHPEVPTHHNSAIRCYVVDTTNTPTSHSRQNQGNRQQNDTSSITPSLNPSTPSTPSPSPTLLKHPISHTASAPTIPPTDPARVGTKASRYPKLPASVSLLESIYPSHSLHPRSLWCRHKGGTTILRTVV